MNVTHKSLNVVVLATITCLTALAGASMAQEGAEKCYLKKFIKNIGFEALFVEDDSLVEVVASLGYETKCEYNARFAPCIQTAFKRLKNASELVDLSEVEAKKMAEIVNSIELMKTAGASIVFSYKVQKGSLVSSPKFSEITFYESVFGRIRESVPGDKIANFLDPVAFREICHVGTISEEQFIRELEK
jgi:hypothetical protein